MSEFTIHQRCWAGHYGAIIEQLYDERRGTRILVEVSADMNWNDETNQLEYRQFHGKTDWSFRLMNHMTDNLARWIDPDQYDIDKNAIREAKAVIAKYVASVPEILKKGEDHPAWIRMSEAIEKYKQPKSYLGDVFFHDLHALAKINPDKFVWELRNSGSYLFVQYSSAVPYRAKQAGGHDENHYFCWNGRSLIEKPAKEWQTWAQENLPNEERKK